VSLAIFKVLAAVSLRIPFLRVIYIDIFNCRWVATRWQ